MEYYLGSDWRSKATNASTPALKSYLAHLEELEKETPLLLLPYAFRLYVANMSGGPRTLVMVN